MPATPFTRTQARGRFGFGSTHRSVTQGHPLDQKQIIAANLNLTDGEAEKFWPIYEQYTVELSKMNDTKGRLDQGICPELQHNDR
jgi:hypothetical protein